MEDGLEADAEFSDRLTDERINGQINPVLYTSVIDTDASECTETEICPSIVVEITLVGSVEKQLLHFGADDFNILKKAAAAAASQTPAPVEESTEVPVF